jgi:hypothetical protein
MEALTPASPDSLPPVGDLVGDEPFWRYPLGATARQGVTHLRVWRTADPEPGHLAVVTETGSAAAVTESAPHIWAALARRYGPSVVLLEHTRHRRRRKARRSLTSSASAPTAARTGSVSGRPRRNTPVTPGLSSGWPVTAIRSSASPRAGSTGARTRVTDSAARRPAAYGAAVVPMVRVPGDQGRDDAGRGAIRPAPSPRADGGTYRGISRPAH